MPFELSKHEPIPAGVRRIVQERIDRALALLKASNGSITDHAVHEVRKRFKETRGTLRLVRTELGEKTFQRENQAFRDAGRPLSTLRDAKVLIDRLDDLTKRANGQLKRRELEALREELLDRRRKTRELTLQHDHAKQQVLEALREARSRLSDWPLEHKGWKAIEPGLRKVYKQGRRALNAVRAEPSDNALHEWRKRSKDLRYELELLSGVDPKAITPLAKQAKDLTDLLGEDHDLCVLKIVACQQEAAEPGTVDFHQIAALIDTRRATLQKKAEKLGEKLYGDKADDFVRQLHKDWKRARQAKSA